MKTNLLILAIALASFSGCSTMYKSAQTPDDVYYSPARPFEAAEKNNSRENQDEYLQVNNHNGEDRMIRMGITDSRWRTLNNDYSYSPYNYSIYSNVYSNSLFNNPYNYNNYSLFNNPYNNYGLQNSHFYYNDYYYNPYYSPYPMYPVYLTPAALPKNTTPRTSNLSGYGRNYNNSNFSPVRSAPSSAPAYNNSNNTRRSGLGEVLNKVFAPAPANTYYNNNNNANNTNNQQRTYTPPPSNNNSNSSSSGSSASGSSGGRVSRPN